MGEILFPARPESLSAQRRADGSPSNYDLLWFDEFVGPTLDRAGRWCTRYQYGGGPAIDIQGGINDPACIPGPGRGVLDFLNDEQQRYRDNNLLDEPLHQVIAEGADTFLRLRATKTRAGVDPAAPYESAMVRSKATFRPTQTRAYYITARCRLPDAKGTWPALWLNTSFVAPDGGFAVGQWPPEIDILEAALPYSAADPASVVQQSVKVQNWGGSGQLSYLPPVWQNSEHAWTLGRTRRTGDATWRDGWHEWGLLWTDTSATFFVDTIPIVRYRYEWKGNDGQFANEAHVILNLAVGGSWAGANGIDDAKLPFVFDIDHVRVYARDRTPAEVAADVANNGLFF